MKTVGYVFAGLLGLFVLLLVYSHFQAQDPEVKERRFQEAKIAYCMEQSRDDIHDRGTRQAFRATCQTMRDSFIAKYGRAPR